MREEIVFNRDAECVKIPSGDEVDVPAGTEAFLVQARNGHATLRIPSRMWQVQLSGENLDAIERPDGEPLEIDAGEAHRPDDVPDDMVGAVYDQLSQCYDPEIPVNIVELGLVYDVSVERVDEEAHDVHVKMTLTAQGCGMGTYIAKQAEQNIDRIPGVRDNQVEIVWDPPWTEDMMSEEARQKLGFV